MSYQNLLVFLEFPDPTHPSLGLLKSLSYMDVTLVGFHPVQAGERLDAETRADMESKLEAIALKFEDHGSKQPRARWPEAFVVPSALSEHSLLGERAG